MLTQRERRAIAPPEQKTVSEWADNYRILPPRASKLAGRWNTERTPYLRVVMDAFCDPDIDEIIICSGTQLGKTEAILNMIAYAIDVDTGPALLVLPTEDICNSMSRNRIQPMIEASDRLTIRKSPRADDFGLTEMKFETMTFYIAWSNSPAVLSSRPVRYVFMDEVDKFPPFSGREADPMLLAEKRTQSYYGFRKIVFASTPTFETGNIWKKLQKSNIYLYAVPCVHCGKRQTLKFSQLKWQGETPDDAKKTAYYECEYCKGKILDKHKYPLLASGEWVLSESKGDISRIGFHLSSLYSPFLPFGEVARAFLSSKDDIAELMDFVNSYLAEPFKEVQTSKKVDEVAKCVIPELERGIPPDDTQAIVCGVDVQEVEFYYVIYAIAQSGVYLILNGRCETWQDIERIVYDMRFNVSGKSVSIFCTFIDAGARTSEVYDFCRAHPNIYPTKGADMQKPIKETDIEKTPRYLLKYARPLKLILVDSSYFKEKIYRMIDVQDIHFHREVDTDFLEQMVSEEKKRIRKGFKYVDTWVRVNRRNHYLDATVYAIACSEYINARQFIPICQKSDTPRNKKIYEKARQMWIPAYKDWL
ncbi:MAG: phage terminase large subunit family protein [Syntrophorhabdaceae bacterium]|nr:phage terminase large subunit family protein [Syntrophorhabdaceae bacterium]